MQFSNAFFQRLARTNDIGDAYSVAAAELRSHYRHPYYWGQGTF
ncbi:CHAT domain-containing protein [Paraburkholderia sp. Cpub6]|nr:CHAT domain-containing protein [Paraburkholderia sp. Cpub6]